MAIRAEVERKVSRLAGLVSLVVSVAPPIAFTWDVYTGATSRLEVEASQQAKAITEFVGRNPTAWQLPTDRLLWLLEANRTLGGEVRVVNRDGQVIVRAGAPSEWPVMARRAEFFDFGSPVGEVEVMASGRGILYRAVVVLGVSIGLGLLIYGPLRRIPLRAIETANRELETSETRYRRLVESAPLGIVKHQHGAIEFVNSAFMTMVGAGDARELVGRDFLDFVVPEHRGQAAEMIVALSGGAASLPLKRLTLLRRDESVLETEIAGVSNLEGDAWIAQLIILNVSDRQRAHDLIRKSRDRLLRQQRALAAIARSDPFVGGDAEAAARALTEAAAKQLEVERVGLWMLTPARDAMRCADLYQRSLDRHSSGAVVTVRSAGRFIEAIGSEEAIVADDARSDELTRELADAYLDPLGIGSVIDVPVRLRGVIAGVFCHEHVGPPISWTPEQRMFAIAIGNLAALTLEQGARRQAEEEARALRETLERRVGERAAELEETLGELKSFAFSILQDREIMREEVDLGALARQAIARLAEGEPEGRVECLVQPDLEVRCDWLLMQVAMERLVGRAWKASLGAEVPRVEIGEGKVDGQRAFFVMDSGPRTGMMEGGKLTHPADDSRRECGSTATGSGFALAAIIVARHGGRIWAETKPGGGTVIWFTLEPRPDE